METLTTEVKRYITRDWNELFPEMGVYEPMHLLRRVGPLLIGIVLERDSSNRCYRPTFHVHNLARVFPCVSMSLSRPLRTLRTSAPESIDVRDHQNKYRDAAERLSRQTLLPLQGDVSVDDVLTAYRTCLQGEPSHKYESHSYEDMALICAWASQLNKARSVIGEAQLAMRGWPSYVLDKIGDLVCWASRITEVASDPEPVRATVLDEIKSLGVDNIPARDMIVS